MSRLSPLNRQFRSKVSVDPRNPVGVGMCDGCGFWVNYPELRERQQYRGGWSPVGTGLFVCKTCDDVPQAYYRRQVLAPDPVPLLNPRPDPSAPLPNGSVSGWGYVVDSNNNIITSRTGAGPNPNLVMGATPVVTVTSWVAPPPATASALQQNGWFGGGG